MEPERPADDDADDLPVDPDADDLPLDPDERRAAVAAQVVDLRAQLAALAALVAPAVADGLSDTAPADQVLRAFKADLAAVYTRAPYAAEPDLVIDGLSDVVEGLMRRRVRLDPGALPILLTRIQRVARGVMQVDEAAADVAAAGTEPRMH